MLRLKCFLNKFWKKNSFKLILGIEILKTNAWYCNAIKPMLAKHDFHVEINAFLLVDVENFLPLILSKNCMLISLFLSKQQSHPCLIKLLLRFVFLIPSFSSLSRRRYSSFGAENRR